jgi:6-phosphogluconate dehydrogenase
MMQIGMIGLGRMGGNMVQRLLRGGHECVVFDAKAEAVAAVTELGASGTHSLEEFVSRLQPPRTIWMMLPAHVVDQAIEDLSAIAGTGDVMIDGANSNYIDDIRRAAALRGRGIHYVDAGVSGGIWGLERGYCLMIGGDAATVSRLDPIFKTLAPGADQAGAAGGTAPQGYLHCGQAGAGHFVKMVHNGIEYALMAAYAEGFNLLTHANAGAREPAGAVPLRHPEHFQYDFDLAAIAEVWRHGSVISSWLLDLTARALAEDPALTEFSEQVSDSGEGRWTAHAAIDSETPAPVLTAALFQRYSSRGEDDWAGRLLSAMRYQFGGHRERKSNG